jgi:hypothetical protein
MRITAGKGRPARTEGGLRQCSLFAVTDRSAAPSSGDNSNRRYGQHIASASASKQNCSVIDTASIEPDRLAIIAARNATKLAMRTRYAA